MLTAGVMLDPSHISSFQLLHFLGDLIPTIICSLWQTYFPSPNKKILLGQEDSQN